MPSERVVALRWIPVWQRNMLVWVKLAGPAIFGNFGEPLLYMLALGYGLGAFVQGMSELPYPVFLASGLMATIRRCPRSRTRSGGRCRRTRLRST
jgi:hypothetical protein